MPRTWGNDSLKMLPSIGNIREAALLLPGMATRLRELKSMLNACLSHSILYCCLKYVDFYICE